MSKGIPKPTTWLPTLLPYGMVKNKLIKKEAALLRDLLRKLNALKRSISASELRRKGELHQHLKSLTRDMKYLEELVKDTHSSPTEKRVAV